MSAPDLPRGSHQVNHRFHTWGFIFLFGFMLPAMAVHALFFDAERGGGLLAVLALLGAPVAWWLLREARLRIEVSQEGLSVRPYWGEPHTHPWESLHAVRYASGTRTLILEPEGSDPVRISLMRDNVEILARFIMARVPKEAVKGQARPLFRIR
jgi:hypothetical protein